MRNTSENVCIENRNTDFTSNNILFENHVFFIRFEKKKYCGAGESTDNNMEHAHYMLGT
jgi:hypothetical protein